MEWTPEWTAEWTVDWSIMVHGWIAIPPSGVNNGTFTITNGAKLKC